MSQTSAQAAVMEATAARFEQTSDQLQSTLTRLLAELEGLQTAWRGRGGASFEQVKQAWAADQRRLQAALQETAAAIRTAGHQYSTTDADAASRVSAVQSTVNLAL